MHDYALHKSTFTLLYFTWLSLSQVSQGVAQSYLADELCHPADTEARRRLYVLSRQHCWLSAVNRQRPSFTCRRPSCMERSSAARHVSTVTGRLPQSPGEDTQNNKEKTKKNKTTHKTRENTKEDIKITGYKIKLQVNAFRFGTFCRFQPRSPTAHSCP